MEYSARAFLRNALEARAIKYYNEFKTKYGIKRVLADALEASGTPHDIDAVDEQFGWKKLSSDIHQKETPPVNINHLIDSDHEYADFLIYLAGMLGLKVVGEYAQE